MSDEPIRCPRCRRTLAMFEDGEVVVRLRDRFRVVVRAGEIECVRCGTCVPVLTETEAPA